MHFLTGLIISKEDYTEEQIKDINDEDVGFYLQEFSQKHEIEPYIMKTKEEYEEEFKFWKKKVENPEYIIKDFEKEYFINGKLKKITAKEWVKSWEDIDGDSFDKEDNILSTWNKNSFFDWFEIGGRWNNKLNGKNILKVEEVLKLFKLKEGIGNTESETESLKLMKKIEEGDKDYNEFYVYYLVFDGSWECFEKAEDFTEEERKKEINKYLEILENHKEDWFVVLDAHN